MKRISEKRCPECENLKHHREGCRYGVLERAAQACVAAEPELEMRNGTPVALVPTSLFIELRRVVKDGPGDGV